MTSATTVRLPVAVPVCRYASLPTERGAAALVGGVQIAVFRLHDGSVHAVSHRDPFSGANVMARGIVGTRGDRPTVASPMYKQVFDLETGRCLDDPAHALTVYRVTVTDGVVFVELEELRPGPPRSPHEPS